MKWILPFASVGRVAVSGRPQRAGATRTVNTAHFGLYVPNGGSDDGGTTPFNRM